LSAVAVGRPRRDTRLGGTPKLVQPDVLQKFTSIPRYSSGIRRRMLAEEISEMRNRPPAPLSRGPGCVFT
jgi:hypothetical protein